jgi:ribosomal subunit interface protein
VETQIVIRNAEHSNGLRTFAQEKLAETLARFEHNVLTAVMRLEDITGPAKETARDKLCNLHVKLRTGDIVIKEEDSDFHVAINVAMDRLKSQLSREVGRMKRGVAEG